MGVRFPLEQGRPDLSEIKEVAPPTKSAGEQRSENRVPADAAAQDNIRADEKMPSDTGMVKPIHTGDEPVSSTYKTTGLFIDILA